MMHGPLLVVSTFEKGRGGGHLVRSLVLIRSLRSLKQEAYLHIPALASQDVPRLLRMAQEERLEGSWLIEERELMRTWACIILDRFSTDPEIFAQYTALAPLIGIDEGGPRRKRFDFLIDLLPGPAGRLPPNILSPSLLPLPEHRRPSFVLPRKQALKVLVSFGAEDPGDLTLPVCLALQVPGQTALTALFGRLNQTDAKEARRASLEAAGIRVREGMAELREHLASYDLVLTHFGLTAFESLAARVPVLLLSPGAYHEKLAVQAGFISGGIGEKGARRLRSLLFTPDPQNRTSLLLNEKALRALGDRCEEIRERYGLKPEQTSGYPNRASGPANAVFGLPNRVSGYPNGASGLPNRVSGYQNTTSGYPNGVSGYPNEGNGPPNGAQALSGKGLSSPVHGLSALLASYTLRVPRSCPVCGGTGPAEDPVCGRFPDRTYRRCRRCGMVYLLRTSLPPIEYEKEYFFSFYKQQYGKTYLEDLPHLVQYGKKRLRYAKPLVWSARRARGEDPSQSPARLLDIGCAYGPFLLAAREEGFLPFGMDPAEDAVRYVQEELHIPACRGFFPETPVPEGFGSEGFDLISLWYVVEHFEQPAAVLAELYRLLKPGGVLAFSSPSGSGISGRRSFSGFLERSPPDHWTVWSPGRTGRILRSFGFRLKTLVISGHHPERFPGVGRFLGTGAGRKSGLAYGLVLWISRIFHLGDTFEVYAVKEPAGREPAVRKSAGGICKND